MTDATDATLTTTVAVPEAVTAHKSCAGTWTYSTEPTESMKPPAAVTPGPPAQTVAGPRFTTARPQGNEKLAAAKTWAPSGVTTVTKGNGPGWAGAGARQAGMPAPGCVIPGTAETRLGKVTIPAAPDAVSG